MTDREQLDKAESKSPRFTEGMNSAGVQELRKSFLDTEDFPDFDLLLLSQVIYDAMERAKAPSSLASKESREPMLLEVIRMVRCHPEFDQGGPMAEMMDQALAGAEHPDLLIAAANLRMGRKPSADTPSVVAKPEPLAWAVFASDTHELLSVEIVKPDEPEGDYKPEYVEPLFTSYLRSPSAPAAKAMPDSLNAEWCMDAFWRVNPGRNATVPSLYLLDFAREVLRVFSSTSSVPSASAKQQFDELLVQDTAPLERLRFFCSLAMKGQDWLDAEPFFDALASSAPPTSGRRDLPPHADLVAGDKFRDSLLPRADVKEPFPLWHGWAIMDAFLAGAEYARSAIARKETPCNWCDPSFSCFNDVNEPCHKSPRPVDIGKQNV